MFDLDSLKDTLTNFWVRYGASWLIKALTVWCGYTATQAQTTAAKAVPAIGVLIGVIVDLVHATATHNSASASGAALATQAMSVGTVTMAPLVPNTTGSSTTGSSTTSTTSA